MPKYCHTSVSLEQKYKCGCSEPAITNHHVVQYAPADHLNTHS